MLSVFIFLNHQKYYLHEVICVAKNFTARPVNYGIVNSSNISQYRAVC